MNTKKLTAKQLKYVKNRMNGMTKVDSYAEAYGRQGEPKQNLYSQALSIEKNKEVQKALESMKERLLKNVVLTKEDREKELADIIYDKTVSTSDRLKAIDIYNKMTDGYVNKIQAEVVTAKLEDIIQRDEI